MPIFNLPGHRQQQAIHSHQQCLQLSSIGITNVICKQSKLYSYLTNGKIDNHTHDISLLTLCHEILHCIHYSHCAAKRYIIIMTIQLTQLHCLPYQVSHNK